MTEAPYFTVDTCTECGREVHGLHNRWTCTACGACSPYAEPPEGWQSEIRQGETTKALPPRLRSPIGSE